MDCPSNSTLAAVWGAPGRVLTINDLGEGLPLDEAGGSRPGTAAQLPTIPGRGHR